MGIDGVIFFTNGGCLAPPCPLLPPAGQAVKDQGGDFAERSEAKYYPLDSLAGLVVLAGGEPPAGGGGTAPQNPAGLQHQQKGAWCFPLPQPLARPRGKHHDTTQSSGLMGSATRYFVGHCRSRPCLCAAGVRGTQAGSGARGPAKPVGLPAGFSGGFCEGRGAEQPPRPPRV